MDFGDLGAVTETETDDTLIRRTLGADACGGCLTGGASSPWEALWKTGSLGRNWSVSWGALGGTESGASERFAPSREHPAPAQDRLRLGYLSVGLATQALTRLNR